MVAQGPVQRYAVRACTLCLCLAVGFTAGKLVDGPTATLKAALLPGLTSKRQSSGSYRLPKDSIQDRGLRLTSMPDDPWHTLSPHNFLQVG